MNENEAREEMFAMLATAWNADAQEVAGTPFIPPILWQGKEYSQPDLASGAYGRASVHHRTSYQSSLGGADGKKRFTREGFFQFQCFSPMSVGIGNPLTISSGLSKIVKDAFEGRSSPGGIWFRECRLNEIGPVDGWYVVNVIAEFTYDEVK